MKRIGIFGGSFNPIHVGHVALAKAAREACGLDEVWLMVSPQNPLKRNMTLLDDQLRLELAEKALEGVKGVKASDYEMHLPKPSYTWHTLQALEKDYPDCRFTLLIGGDNWAHFQRWYHWEDIQRMCDIAVYPREGYAGTFDAPLVNVSSTEIREKVSQGQSIQGLVPDSIVEDVMRLYGTKGSLLLVPSGGLANRMRAIASAHQLCMSTESRLQVVWFQGWGMHAAFSDLFEAMDATKMELREATLWDYVINDRPRRHNLWMPWLPQKLYYGGDVKNELEIAALRDAGFDFEIWLRGHKRYMSCYDEFGMVPDTCYAELFHPNRQVMEIVTKNESQFSAYTIGMHIRRTDNIDSIRRSPLELFVEAGQRELAVCDDLTIFLATDSEDVKNEMRSVFGNRVVTSEHEATRDSITGLREGLADMWTLSRTQRIYGSAGSSFSVMASRVGGNELQILER